LGTEGGGTGFWCEPKPPAKWNGKKVVSRNPDGSCVWGEDLPTQCFGLGPEKMNAAGVNLNTEECAAACCSSTKPNEVCEMYQEIPGRGCFYGHGPGLFCEEYRGGWEGGRKCIVGGCGGMEKEILEPYLARLNQTQL